MKTAIRVLQVGLGAIGQRVTKVLLDRNNVDIVGAIDIDPEKQGEDLGHLAGQAPLGITITHDLDSTLNETDIDIAVLTTSSLASVIEKQLEPFLNAKIPVVTTCEELSFPWKTFSAEAKRIDALAKANKVAVLSTGVNPGFLMDFLPSVSTAICQRVSSIKVSRIQDASTRRLPFQKKIGVGLTRSEFAARIEKKLLRHVGLIESVHFIAHQLNWRLEKVIEDVSPILDVNELATGICQKAVGFVDQSEKIVLEFIASVAIEKPQECISVRGEPNFDLTFSQPINGDIATAAITVNAIPTVMKAKPGLRTMADIEAVTYWE